ncbi:hypothetical protein, partial [Vibrio parahaemolyticus]|uniref:hypothetical protein n=1 Tax=Vibrio parahaemolyticus TaxID=670 RepID=UPI0018A192A4
TCKLSQFEKAANEFLSNIGVIGLINSSKEHFDKKKYSLAISHLETAIVIFEQEISNNELWNYNNEIMTQYYDHLIPNILNPNLDRIHKDLYRLKIKTETLIK